MTRFDCFVVFAEMRTGSNFLEANLNAFGGISCLGEVFNPHFIGYPNAEDVLGITQEERDAKPLRLLDAVRAAPGMAGFRYFHDHDPRVLDALLSDPKVGKVVLTRNPVDSYISWKIAQATGQWKLTNIKKRKEGKAVFDAAEFEAHLDALQAFQVQIMNRLQRTGQTAFYVAYEDLQDVEVMNGLAQWLGTEARLDSLNTALKRQNPQPVAEKVENFEAMAASLARLDPLQPEPHAELRAASRPRRADLLRRREDAAAVYARCARGPRPRCWHGWRRWTAWRGATCCPTSRRAACARGSASGPGTAASP